jgi:CheY-like chemotaxis protein
LRFNAKKDKNPDEGGYNGNSSPPFMPNAPDAHSISYASSRLSLTEISISGSNKLTVIDTLSLDKNSRLTLTKSVRNALDLNPNDKITFYRDLNDRNIFFITIQKETQAGGIKTITTETTQFQLPQTSFENPRPSESKESSTTWILMRHKRKARKKDDDRSKIDKDSVTMDFAGKYGKYDGQTNSEEERKRGTTNTTTTLYSTPIILIDDESDLVSVVETVLKFEGYKNIRTFSESRNALTHILENKDRKQHYKLAVIDVRMPDINGINMYRILKILNPSIGILFMTALDAIDEIMSIYPEIKPSDILRKPFDIQKLIETVNNKVISISGIGKGLC